MEVITAQLEILLWVFTPVGAIVALVLFGLLTSGLVGRIFPNLEVSGSARHTAQRPPLETAPQRERIIK